jgi:tetraacyldisaccharide 4'-kinase
VLRRLLLPLAWAYGGVAAVRRGAYRRGLLRVERVPVPVISVGALAAGGSGKTPVAGFLAGLLLDQGHRVAIVHGGYRGREAGRVQRVDPDCRWQPGAARRLGDEPLLLAAWHPRALVFCGRDKLAAARRAVEAGAELVVLDDGFQHRRLARDLDLLLDDGRAPEAPFPAGLARELPSAAAEAHLRWEHHRDGELPAGTAPLASRCLPEALHALDGTRLGSAVELRGRRVFLLAGIARPGAFLASVERLGARPVGHCWAGDHSAFSSRQLRAAARSRADVLLCTEKDAARLGASSPSAELVYLACRLELTRGLPLLRERLAALGGV